FYNDYWRVSGNVTANLGLRDDRNHAVDSSGSLVSTQDAWSPLRGVVVYPLGNQKWSITAGIAQYVDGLANPVANGAAAGGNPDTYQLAYLGPDITYDPHGVLPPAATAIQQVFDWFDANNGTSRPLIGTVT